MSLFPAYQEQTNKDTSNNPQISNQSGNLNKNLEWLNNLSYQKVSECLESAKNTILTDDSDEENDSSVGDSNDDSNTLNINVINKASREAVGKKTSAAVKQKTNDVKNQLFENEFCYEDKSRNKRFCSIDTLEHELRPRYKLSKYKLNFKHHKIRMQKYFQRYYLINLDSLKHSQKVDQTTEAEVLEDNNVSATDELKNIESEVKIKNITEEFNKKITENPKDISIWHKYILFQDEIAQQTLFSLRKKNFKQMIIQKKLSIADKGLMINRDSIELLKTKLDLMSELLPADQLLEQIEKMLQKDSKNIVLWQALIIVVQTSCALCKVSKVLNLYTKCFPILKEKTKTNPKVYERQSLELLYQCLMFLRNAGLWEQMWEIIRMNLCLNLAMNHKTLQCVNTINENTLMSMEELILTSKLPLNQLWLRVESLRENCHWTSADVDKVDINLIGDDKRLVAYQDISDFIYPTISQNSNFHLIVSLMVALKIPLLPTRHCSLKDFNLEEHYWSIDSLEFVLPMIYSSICFRELSYLFDKRVIIDLLDGKLTSGPQCLKYHPARESFLNFIRSVFHTVAQNSPDKQKTSILIWWLKFERLLIFLIKHDPLQVETQSENKKLRSVLKNFLKKPEHRDNLHFYREFALIESELGDQDAAVLILKTAISSKSSSSFTSIEEKSAFFSLYRTIFEILLLKNNNSMNINTTFQEVTGSLKSFVSRNFSYDYKIPVEEMLYNEMLKYLMNPIRDESEDAFLLPNIHCDILVCYIYLLYIVQNRTEDLNDILDLFDRCLIHCDKCPHLKERFYELKVRFLQFHYSRIVKESINNNNTLSVIVQEALATFPNNFYLLSTNAIIESKLQYWKIKAYTEMNTNVWSVFAKCLAGRARIANLKSIEVKESVDAIVNKMLAFHKTVSQTKKIQGCPLIWKFYMLLIREHNLCQKKGEEVYYEAVNQCPWARSVYLTAAEIAPQILSQIQDLMKEKEIRIHVTPEELDILRK